jgi:hypothetical protein
MKNLIRKILKESDWDWAQGPTKITKTIGEWYKEIDYLGELLELTDVVEISGIMYGDGDHEYATLKNDLFIIEIIDGDSLYPPVISGLAVKEIRSDNGDFLVLGTQSDTTFGDFPGDMDLEMTIIIND